MLVVVLIALTLLVSGAEAAQLIPCLDETASPLSVDGAIETPKALPLKHIPADFHVHCASESPFARALLYTGIEATPMAPVTRFARPADEGLVGFVLKPRHGPPKT